MSVLLSTQQARQLIMDANTFLRNTGITLSEPYAFDDVWQAFVQATRKESTLDLVHRIGLSFKKSGRDYVAVAATMEDNGIEFSFRKEKEPVLLIISIGTTRWGRGCFGVPLSEDDIVRFLE